MPAKILIWFVFPAANFLLGQPILPEQISDLRNLSIRLSQRQAFESETAAHRASLIGMPIRRTLPNGRVTQLQSLTGRQPLYYITTNLNAARSVGADRLWPGGGMGFQLTGYGIVIGIWDEASILPTHQELKGRIVSADGTTLFSNHATHVAGTIIAEGLVATAHGMASESEVLSYDWNNDASEVTAAAADGLVISNHSYSYIAGWQLDIPKDGWNWWGDVSIDSREDYLFGFYDSTAFYWDQIAFKAPFLCIVVAAGNDRGDLGPAPGESHWVFDGTRWVQSNESRNPDGDYDCLPGGCQVAKNVLVVGAVEDLPAGYTDRSDVIMLDFSSRGPTDDGRIKPDIVANGWEVFSSVASGSDDYDHFSGTSMASPGVAGCLALLCQHYADTHHGKSPLGSSLRAIAIHTAYETGDNSGPDYDHGWGLLNPVGAAELISQDSRDSRIIQELELAQNESFIANVCSDGAAAIKVTLTWTDLPGPVPIKQLDPQIPILMNDLDLRITGADGTVYFPWVLDVNTPLMPAVPGDNTSDNVEQVYIETPAPGEYSLAVTHKGLLATGIQPFAMIASGVSFNPLPQVLIWEGDSTAADYSGKYIRTELAATGAVDVTYTTDLPTSLSGFDAVFLSFGPSGALSGRTPLDQPLADSICVYLEGGGNLYLEGGDVLGVDQEKNELLQSLLGIALAEDGGGHSFNGLQGLSGTVAEGMLFTESTQANGYPDTYFPGTGLAAFEESDFGVVAIQNIGIYHQRTIVFSYALACLVDGTTPNTRADLLMNILDFLLEEAPPPPNTPPTAVNDLAEVLEDSLTTIFPLQNDTDADGHDLRLFSLFAGYHGIPTVMAGDTTILYVPEENFFGSDSFLYSVSDGLGGIDTAAVQVSVLPVNDPPVAKDDSIVTVEDTPCSIHVLTNDSDIDADALQVAAATAGEHGSCVIDEAAQSIMYTPENQYTGEDTFGYILSDSHGAFAMASVHVTVLPENDPVIAVSDTVTTMEDIPVSVPVLANDIDYDEDSLSIIGLGVPGYGEVRIEPDGIVLYHPESNYYGEDEFHYIVTDNRSGADTARVMVTIMPVNDAPVAVDDTLVIDEDNSGWIKVVANDLEYDGEQILLNGSTWTPIHGEVTEITCDSLRNESMELNYSPYLDYFGLDSFYYVISDGTLLDTGQVRIIVHAVNDAPGPFNLLEPLGDTTHAIIHPDLFPDSLVFRWEQSLDVEMDSVYYLFQTADEALFNLMDLKHISVPSVVLQYEYLASQALTSGIHGTVRGEWTILATDGMDTTAAGNGPLWLIIDTRPLGISTSDNVPDQFVLYQNYPNPFNPSTSLAFDLPEGQDIDLIIYNLRGEEVIRLVDNQLPAGKHHVLWNGKLKDGREASSGIYIFIVRTPMEMAYRKMILLR